ncbi:hypothetical protein QJS66_21925 [Kocuria rhizophila]|nr:hypothetical protein QJS66_21925 [Kocuria rhizophila]
MDRGAGEPESQLNALEGAVRAMRAKGAPGMTLRTTEHDEWILGDGGHAVRPTGGHGHVAGRRRRAGCSLRGAAPGAARAANRPGPGAPGEQREHVD